MVKKLFILIALILSGTAHAQTDDMVLVEELVDFIYEDGGFYTITPWSQRDTICFRAHVLNNGSNVQTNVRLHVLIKDTSQLVVYDDTSAAVPSIASGVDDTLLFITGQNCFVPPDTFMSYTIYYDILQDEVDQNPANDMDTISIEMADSVYARDYGTAQNFISSHQFPNGGNGDEIGVYYDIVDTTRATSVSFFVGSQSSTNISIVAIIRSLDNQCNPATPIAGSIPSPITVADLNKWKTIDVASMNDLVPNAACPFFENGRCLVSLQITGYTVNDSITIGVDQTINLPGNNTNCSYYILDDNSWYDYLGIGQPMIRLNVTSKECRTFSAFAIKNFDPTGPCDGMATASASGGTPPYTYLWSHGDTNAVADSLCNGFYFVTVCDSFNCCETKSVIVLQEPGISENESHHAITIHPNPTEGKFTVQGATAEIQIFDLFGRLVLRTNKAQIDMSSYPAGLYVWRIGEGSL